MKPGAPLSSSEISGWEEALGMRDRWVINSAAPLSGPWRLGLVSSLKWALLGLVKRRTGQTGPACPPPGPGGACPPPQGWGRERGQVPQVKTWVSSDAVTLCCGRHSEQQDVPAYGCWRLSHCPGDQEPLGRRARHPLWPQSTRGSRSGPLRASLFRPILLGPCPQAAHRPAGGEPGMGAPGRGERGRPAG